MEDKRAQACRLLANGTPQYQLKKKPQIFKSIKKLNVEYF